MKQHAHTPVLRVVQRANGQSVGLGTVASVDRYVGHDSIYVHSTLPDTKDVVPSASFLDSTHERDCFVSVSLMVDHTSARVRTALLISPQEAVTLRDALTAALRDARKAGRL